MLGSGGTSSRAFGEGATMLFLMIISLISAVGGGYIAKKKGRSVPLWASLGLLVPLIPVFFVAILPPK